MGHLLDCAFMATFLSFSLVCFSRGCLVHPLAGTSILVKGSQKELCEYIAVSFIRVSPIVVIHHRSLKLENKSLEHPINVCYVGTENIYLRVATDQRIVIYLLPGHGAAFNYRTTQSFFTNNKQNRNADSTPAYTITSTNSPRWGTRTNPTSPVPNTAFARSSLVRQS